MVWGFVQQWGGEETLLFLHCKWARGRKVFCPIPPPLCGWRKRGWVQQQMIIRRAVTSIVSLHCKREKEFPRNPHSSFSELATLFPLSRSMFERPKASFPLFPSSSSSSSTYSQRSEEGDDDEGGKSLGAKFDKNLWECSFIFLQIFCV